jgi:hypothetical protein
MTKRTYIVALAILAVSTLVSACASRTISQVLADPSRYRNREVKLSGAVVDSYSLANRGAYRIDDNTGQLWVVSDRGTPRKGVRVTVKGTIREGFNLGSLGEQIHLPGVGVGLVLLESLHKGKQ